MIICPSCKHQESEGELFCSNCGARIWGPGTEQSKTAVFDSKQLRPATTGGIGPLAMSSSIKPGQVALSISGTIQPVMLEGRQEYYLGREGGGEPHMLVVNLNPYGAREKGVSRLHAILRVDQHQLLLVDLGSTNGTRLNGALLQAQKPTRLENSDEIQLGKLSLKVNFNL